MAALALLAGMLIAAGTGDAEVVSPKPEAVTIALYHQGMVSTRSIMSGRTPWGTFAYVTETRTIELPAGPSVIRFKGVASTMVAESASIDGLPAGTLERNFDYDLLSPGSLLLHSIGRNVHLVRTDPATGKETQNDAVVRAAPNGVVLESGGKFEALHCGGPPERLVFDGIPQGLSDTPTFSVRAAAATAGRYTVKLSYIASDINWSADYVARIAPDGESLALSGAITLANFSDTSFADAPTQVVGGNPDINGWDRADEVKPADVAAACWPMTIDWATRAAVAQAQQELQSLETVIVVGGRISQVGVYASSPSTAVMHSEDVGDYKLYSLPERTTLAARQTKQVHFLDAPQVKFRRVYTAKIGWPGSDEKPRSERVAVEYRFDNREEDGVGQPLPAGTIAVMATDWHGAPVLLGEGPIDDTPIGLPVRVETGGAHDVRVDARVVHTERLSKEHWTPVRHDLEVTVTNRKPVPVAFELSQSMDRDDMRLLTESMRHTMYRGAAMWHFDLAPEQSVTMRYSTQYGEW